MREFYRQLQIADKRIKKLIDLLEKDNQKNKKFEELSTEEKQTILTEVAHLEKDIFRLDWFQD